MKSEDILIEAMAVYLRDKGWHPVVGGPVVIQQQLYSQKYNYELVIRFTGKPPSDSQSPNSSPAKSPTISKRTGE